MTINFLNVGQGDSIVLEWDYNGTTKYGIIDCKLTNNGNPIIDYLNVIKPTQIEFIILSHPHTDHFSGMIDLLEYLVLNKIDIRYYMHTGTLSPNRIKIAVKGPDASYELGKLYTLIYNLKKSHNLKVVPLNEMAYPSSLNNLWRFIAYSPSTTELDKYSSSANYNLINSEEDPENEKKGNLLSTFFVFFTDKSYILLTSDCEKDSFFRIDSDRDCRELFQKRRLILAQIPHHGSAKNYKSIFWKKKKDKALKTPAIISVGRNIYKHPSLDVINDLEKLQYTVYTTEPLPSFTNTSYQNNLLLNMVSQVSSVKSKGVKFELNDGGAVYLNT